MLLAHFTPAEIPGTVAVLLIGALIGAAAVRRSLRTLAGGLLALAGFATLASLADSQGWDGGVATAIDVGFLATLIPVAVLALRAADRERKVRP
jgi:hypothetical protein